MYAYDVLKAALAEGGVKGQAAQERIDRHAARLRLLKFARYTFPTYQTPKHLRLLASKLEAVERGEIKRLLITMPPRHGKTELAGIRFPAWYLGRNPDHSVIFCSYAASLAHAKSRECRNVIDSRSFQAVFGRFSSVERKVEIDQDRRKIQAWGVKGRRGGMLAAGVGGGVTGYGAELFIIDDPHKNRQEANSATLRETVWNWYASTARTRLEPQAAIVGIQTRWHLDDWAGRLLRLASIDPAADQWEVLHLPAIDEDGNALWAERFSADELQKIKATIGSWEFEALYQGRPRPLEGALFRRDWFRIVPKAPDGLSWVRFWDLAATTKQTSDYTAGVCAAIAEDGMLFVRDVVRGRWEWPDARRVIKQTALADGPGTVIGIEEAGIQLAMTQEMRRDPGLVAHTIRGVKVDRDKVARANPWADRAKDGRVSLVAGPWVGPFLAEACDFPLGEHDDQVDAVSGAVGMLGKAKIEIRWA